jgi:predicted DCC family thiol-disulfide oxidoreductase YuxK
VPRPLRDWLYDCIARNRYRLFGQRQTCLVPTPEIAGRFLG